METDLLMSQFLNITATEDTATARHLLESTNWDLQQAILLFFTGNDTPQPLTSPASNNPNDLRAPLPITRATLYGDAYFPTERTINPTGWESSEDSEPDNLEQMFRPPRQLIFAGTFQEAKEEAQWSDRWLLVNVQSMSEFNSHRLNRDVWSNEPVSEAIRGNFVFWQEYNDTIEGLKVMSYYKVETVPAVLVIDPVTGQMMRSWFGLVEPFGLLEDLLGFMDKSPKEKLNDFLGKKKIIDEIKPDVEMEVAAPSWGDEDEWPVEEVPEDSGLKYTPLPEDSGPEYPPLPEESAGDRALLCRVAVRFPNGQRMQRFFLKTDPIQLLWSFCYSKFEESEKRLRFSLINALPGRSTGLDYEKEATFEESGIANSMITVVLEN